MTTHSEPFPLGPSLPRRRSAVRWAAYAFLLTIAGVAIFVAAFFVGYARLHDGRAVPGVSVAGVAVGGLDPAAAEARVRSSLPSVSAGALTIEAGDRTERIGYAEIGRDYDVDGALAEAFAVGRSGEFVDLAAEQVRTLVRGVDIPIAVRYDRAALERRVAAIAEAAAVPARDARIREQEGRYVAVPAVDGQAFDATRAREAAVAAVDSASTDDTTITLAPRAVQVSVTTAEAETAAAAANAMVAAPVTLRDGDTELAIAVEQVRAWVALAPTDDGFSSSIDETAITAAVEGLAEDLDVPPVDAAFAFARGGGVTATPGRAGRRVDVPATVSRVVALLETRAAGGADGAVGIASAPVAPRFTTAQAEAAAPRVRRVSAWTTSFIPGPSNFYGKNIAVPTSVIHGTVVGPGRVFDFWKVVGDVSREAGYGPGGAIINGRTESTGALAGGICSCSTTIFNAALRYGLEMGKRQNHYYYITRYPMGLDATVWKSSGGAQQSMSFRNDTDYPILIRGINRRGSVRFEIWSVPSGRTVQFTRPRVADPIPARDTLEYTDDLAPGVRQRVEYPADGFKVWVTRTVRDRDGAVIHRDEYFSNYRRVDGVTLVGRGAGDPPDGTIVYLGG